MNDAARANEAKAAMQRAFDSAFEKFAKGELDDFARGYYIGAINAHALYVWSREDCAFANGLTAKIHAMRKHKEAA